jgi:2Fe-2S ferredoxin
MIENSTLSTDLTCRIDVVDRAGSRHVVAWSAEQSLMEALRDNDLPVLASCGGKAACATCHVFLKPAIIVRLGPRNEDEQELLEETDAYNAGTSRLACQVRHDPLLDGIAVQLAPEEE